jgi:hypothetical protein
MRKLWSVKKPTRVLVLAFITSIALAYGYKLSRAPNSLERIGLSTPVQRFFYQSRDWLWDILYVKAHLSKADLQGYLASVTSVKVNGLPTHQAISLNKSNYSNHFVSGDEDFFPSYAPNIRGGLFQIRNSKGTRFHCKYLYVPIDGSNSYLLCLKAVNSEGP